MPYVFFYAICFVFFTQPHFKKDLQYLAKKVTSTRRFRVKRGHLETRARNKGHQLGGSRRLKLWAGTSPAVLHAGGGTPGSALLGVRRTFLPSLLISDPPVPIKTGLGKDNENTFLHFLTILPDEVLQSRSVSREDALAANGNSRMLTACRIAPGAECQRVQEPRLSQRTLL